MKTLIALMIFLTSFSFGQGKGHGNGNGNGNGQKNSIFKGHGNGNSGIKLKGPINGLFKSHKSAYRPAKITVFHPSWNSNHSYNRRWVYFPKHNLYWDNWRNHYVYHNGKTWVSQESPPPGIVKVKLQNEKHSELKEKDDDNDEVYKEKK